MNLGKRAKLLWSLFTKGGMTRTDKIILVLGLLYCISPIDIIPDFVPVAGFLDDLLVVLLALRQVTSPGTHHNPPDGKDGTMKDVEAKVL